MKAFLDLPYSVQAIQGMRFEAIIQQLNECKDRDDAKQFLASIANKETLATIAKLQKIHIVKNDRREDIEDKLIEFVIGAKLRTDAIQSLNLMGVRGPHVRQ